MAASAKVIISAQDKTRGAFKSLRASVTQSTKDFGGFRRSLIAVAGAAGLGAVVKSSLATVDALAKTSDRLGIATEKLQGLQHAGELTGVSQKTLEMALQRSTRRIAEAAQGSGEAVKALDELGLSAQALNQLSPDEQFAEIADAMNGVANQGDRVRLAMKLFDSEGVALVNTLRLGSEGLTDINARMEAYGVTLSRVDAANVEQANDAMEEIGLIVKGITNQLAVQLAPIIAGVAQEFSGAAMATGGFSKHIATAIEIGVKGFGYLSNAVRGWQLIIKGGEVLILSVSQLFVAVGQTVSRAINGMLKNAEGAINSVIEMMNRIPGVNVDPVSIKFRVDTEGLRELEDSIKQAQVKASKEFSAQMLKPLPSEKVDAWVADTQAKVQAASERIAAESPGGQAAGLDVPGLPVLTDEQADTTIKNVEKVGASMKANFGETDPLIAGLQAANKELKDMATGAATFQDLLGGIANAITGTVINALTQMASQFLTSQLSNISGIQSAQASATAATSAQAASVGAAWTPAAISASIATFGAASATGLAAFTGAQAAGTAFAVGMGALSNLAGGFMSAEGRASGGPVKAGQMYRVNERGMEFFQPATDGRVIPMGDSRAAEASGGAAPVINITNNISQQSGENEESLAARLSAKIQSDILDKMQRPGAFRRTFAVA